jgi:signal transduction histidine kinase
MRRSPADLHDPASFARTAVRAAPSRRLIARAAAALLAEPRWLRGLDWPQVALGGLIAAVLNAWLAITVVVPEFGDQAASLELVFVDAVAQLAVALLVLVIGTALVNRERSRVPVPVRLAIAVLAGTSVPLLVVHAAAGWEDEWRWQVLLFWRRDTVLWGFAAAAWYCLHRASADQAKLRAAEMSRHALENGLLEARLRALHAQVEPHFLFNTLAHVRRLYRTDPAVAGRMLASFASYLESALAQMREHAGTLGREIDFARAYLDVQQIRMGTRLTVTIDVPEALRAHRYPPMMLISLVENAVKHGVDPLPAGGAIAIEARARAGALEVAVVDTGRGICDKIGSGVGLANLRGRLAALYGARAGLSLAPVHPSGVRAVIRTPLDKVEGRDSRTLSPRPASADAEALAEG